MRVTETKMPTTFKKPPGSVGMKAFEVEHDGCFFGVFWAKEPAMRNGTLAIHVSISKSCAGRVLNVSDDDVRAIERMLLNRGLEWPAEYDIVPFEAGPFARKGVHVFQADKTAVVAG